MVYVATKSGKTRCQLMPLEVDCQSQFINTPYVCGVRANGIRFNADGSYEWVVGDLGDIPTVTLDYGNYRALAWSIEATSSGTTFTHTGTGRSVFVSVESIRFN